MGMRGIKVEMRGIRVGILIPSIPTLIPRIPHHSPHSVPRFPIRLLQIAVMTLSNCFNSINGINRLRKEIERLLSKEMSNIYLKVSI